MPIPLFLEIPRRTLSLRLPRFFRAGQDLLGEGARPRDPIPFTEADGFKDSGSGPLADPGRTPLWQVTLPSEADYQVRPSIRQERRLVAKASGKSAAPLPAIMKALTRNRFNKLEKSQLRLNA